MPAEGLMTIEGLKTTEVLGRDLYFARDSEESRYLHLP